MLKFEFPNYDKMKICWLDSSPETYEKKSAKALKAVRKRIRNDYNLEGGKSETRLPSRLIKWRYANLFPARKRMKKNQERLLRPLEKESEIIII